MWLEPYARKKPFNGWNSQLVSQLILEMNKAKEPLSVRSLFLGRRSVPDDILSRVARRPISKKQLHGMACHYFGTWNQALVSSGLPSARRAHNRFWTHSLIIDSIQHLRRSGHPLSVKTIWRDRSNATSTLLLKPTGRWTTGSGLHDAARRFFASWDRALVKAGIHVDDIKEKPFWTKRKMVIVIQALYRAQIPLNAGFLLHDESKETIRVIKIHTGKNRTGKSLAGAAYRTFGSWDRALKEAGLNPSDFRKKRFKWDRKSISKILRALHRSKFALNGGALSKDINSESSRLILKVSGRKIQARSLYNIGRKNLGSWDETLKYSGFSPSLIRIHSAYCDAKKDQIIEFIQVLYINEFELNSTSMGENTKKIRKFMESKFGRAVGGYSIKNRAKKLFGSWDQALWEAGLNINEIRKRSPSHTTNLPVVLHQLEDTKVAGERRRVKYLGAPPKRPDEILEERDAAKKLKSAMTKMDDDDQDLTERIFDAILQIHHYRDQKQLIKYVTRWLGGDVSENKVASIFNRLSKNMRKTLH